MSSVLFTLQAIRTGPLSTEKHTLEVKATVWCCKRLTCQKSQSYSTENNIHCPFIQYKSFFPPSSHHKKKEKALHLLEVSSGIFIHFVFRNADIPRSSMHHNLVLQGARGNRAALGHSWLEVELSTFLTAASCWRQATAAPSEAKQAFAFLELYRQIK